MRGLNLVRDGEVTLSRQIFNELRRQILAGILAGGEVLPSTREMARSLAVSRNTVLEAYDMLSVEGFIESRQGAAARVIPGLRLEPLKESPASQPKTVSSSVTVDFRTGQPDLRVFPKYLWNKLLGRAVTNLPAEDFGYKMPEGYPALRREIADWLFRGRGLTADPDHIFITSGSTPALWLLADILYDPDRPFALESPSHPGIQAIFQNRNYPALKLAVDENGLRPELLADKRPSAVYVTPSHQFPLGGILPAGRRTEFIRLAREKDFLIIEDDYDSEFRYFGQPVSPLYSLDPSRVIYVGTFSKTVFPALRIGFAILPPYLHNKVDFSPTIHGCAESGGRTGRPG